jgi:hypothetical protein
MYGSNIKSDGIEYIEIKEYLFMFNKNDSFKSK